MTTLENRPNTALLVIDVQNGVVAGNYERDAVVANVGRLVDRGARHRFLSCGCSTPTRTPCAAPTGGSSSPS